MEIKFKTNQTYFKGLEIRFDTTLDIIKVIKYSSINPNIIENIKHYKRDD